MNALEFVMAVQRWAKAQGLCSAVIVTDCSPDSIVTRIEKWAAEHPVKTRQSELLKLFPNVEMYDDVVDLDPCEMDTTFASQACSKRCYECRAKYWLGEMDDG